MKRCILAASIGLLAFLGCQKEGGKVSNVATDYTSALQDDVQKARAAAEKANQAIAAEQSAMAQAQEQTK